MIVGQRLMLCRSASNALITPVHSHPHEQITLVEKGRVASRSRRHAHRVGGRRALFPSGIEHGATILDEEVVLVDIFTPLREEFLKR